MTSTNTKLLFSQTETLDNVIFQNHLTYLIVKYIVQY